MDQQMAVEVEELLLSGNFNEDFMSERDELILLGELREFKTHSLERLKSIEDKVDSLDKFKIKVTVIMASILGIIEISFRVFEQLK